MRQLATTNTNRNHNDDSSKSQTIASTPVVVKGQAVHAMSLAIKRQNASISKNNVTTPITTNEKRSNTSTIESQLTSLSKYAHRIHLGEYA
jgi:hypothetical protein